jgi:hypothetical protein
MANRVFSVAAVVLGSSAMISMLAVTLAAASTHHRHVVSHHPAAGYVYNPAGSMLGGPYYGYYGYYPRHASGDGYPVW